jgi:hypothetical protein
LASRNSGDIEVRILRPSRVFSARHPRNGSAGAAPKKLAATIHVAQTYLGYRISESKIVEAGHRLKHYSVSRENHLLSVSAARIIAHLKHDSASFRLIEGRAGVFHILFEVAGDSIQR